MAHCVKGTNPILRHPLEAPINQVSGLFNLQEGVLAPRVAHHEPNKVDFVAVFAFAEQLQDRDLAELAQAGEFVLCGQSFELCHLEDLHTFRIAGEHGRSGNQLKQDAPSRPDVDAFIISVGAENQFGCAVVAADDVGGVVVCCLVEDFGGAHVTNFKLKLCLVHLVELQWIR